MHLLCITKGKPAIQGSRSYQRQAFRAKKDVAGPE